MKNSEDFIKPSATMELNYEKLSAKIFFCNFYFLQIMLICLDLNFIYYLNISEGSDFQQEIISSMFSVFIQTISYYNEVIIGLGCPNRKPFLSHNCILSKRFVRPRQEAVQGVPCDYGEGRQHGTC